MPERIRTIAVRVEIDTNKRTVIDELTLDVRAGETVEQLAERVRATIVEYVEALG